MAARPKWPMSAYRASPPVMHSTTEPRARSPCILLATKNSTAWAGLSAARTWGVSMICTSPSAPRMKNQKIMTGPKILPMPAVPHFWMKNRPKSTSTVSGRMKGAAASVATSSPSMAESTEMAGVMIPSP